MLELVADKARIDRKSRGLSHRSRFGQAMNLVNGGEVASPNVPGTPVLTPPSTITNFDQYLKEGYMEYLAPVGKGLQLPVGKSCTPAGAEVMRPRTTGTTRAGCCFPGLFRIFTLA